MKQVGYKEKTDEGKKAKNTEKESSQNKYEEEERGRDTGWVEEEEKEEKACSHCASVPTLHTHIFTHSAGRRY